jgi:hypothetical protein
LNRVQQCSDIGYEAGGVQLCVNGVAGAGVRQLEIEKFAGSEADAGAEKTNTRRCKAAQSREPLRVYRNGLARFNGASGW